MRIRVIALVTTAWQHLISVQRISSVAAENVLEKMFLDNMSQIIRLFEKRLFQICPPIKMFSEKKSPMEKKSFHFMTKVVSKLTCVSDCLFIRLCKITFWQRKMIIRAIILSLLSSHYQIVHIIRKFVFQQVSIEFVLCVVPYQLQFGKPIDERYRLLSSKNRWSTRCSDEFCSNVFWIDGCTLYIEERNSNCDENSITFAMIVRPIDEIENIPRWNLTHPTGIKILQ